MAVMKLKTLAAAGAAAATLVVGIMPANAVAPTWTVSAGSAPAGTTVGVNAATQGTAPQITLTDTTSGTVLNCTSGTAAGTTVTGTGLPGQALAKINGNTTGWTGCTAPLGIVLTPQGHGFWSITASGYSAGVTTGVITKIRATVTGTGCSFNVAGSVPITYTNSTGILSVKPTASNLTISNVSGCLGAIASGDKASFQADYLLKANKAAYNPVHITKP